MSKTSTSRSRRRIAVLGAGTLALSMLSPVAFAQGDDRDRTVIAEVGEVALVQVDTPTTETRHRLAALDLDGGIGGTVSDTTQVVLVGDSDRAKLREAGFDWEVEIADLQARDRQAREREEALRREVTGTELPDAAQPGQLSSAQMPRTAQRDALPPRALSQLGTSLAQFDDASELPSGRVSYRTMYEINNEMRYLAQTYPDTVKLFELPEPSLMGVPIYGIEITRDVQTEQGKPELLMTGVHHAREWPTAEMTMEFAWHLLLNDGQDPRVTGLLDQTRVTFVPVVNTDGFNISRSLIQEMRRKNCRIEPGEIPGPNECAHPDNANAGVDPNRNYGIHWGGSGSSDNPTSGSYRGEAPFSEPEIENMRYLLTRNAVSVYISNHTWGDLVLRAPANDYEPEPVDLDLYHGLAEAMAAENGYFAADWPEGLYPASGVAEQFGWYGTGTLTFTFEIGTGGGFHPPYPDGVIAEWPGNREAFMVALEAVANPATHSRISVENAPAGAELQVSKAFTSYTSPVEQPGGGAHLLPIPVEVEVSTTVQDDGRFTWHVQPSLRPSEYRTAYIAESYTLTCSTPEGTVLQTETVTVARGETVDVNLSTCADEWDTSGVSQTARNG